LNIAKVMSTDGEVPSVPDAGIGIRAGDSATQIAKGDIAGRDLTKITVLDRGGPEHLRQLPPPVADLIGRERSQQDIHDFFATPQSPSDAKVRILAISGAVGVGKTSLAVNSSHQCAHLFPDGQLYQTLRDDKGPRRPTDVLADLLLDLGVQGRDMPQDEAHRASVFRSLLHGRHILVFLDGAHSARQVETLLPGSPECGVLVTSWKRLHLLPGATHIELQILSEPHSVQLLRTVVGVERIDLEPDAAREIVKLCGHLPLAVRIAGARLAARPHWQLYRFQQRLSEEPRRLPELREEDERPISASFQLAYQDLGAAEQRAFRLLGLIGGTDFPGWCAGPLLDDPEGEERLDSLVDANLLQAVGNDNDTRYQFHDLLRLFARHLLAEEEPLTEQRAARERLLTAYLKAAHEAVALLEPQNVRIGSITSQIDPPADQVSLEGDPLVWFLRERDNLVDAVEQAYEHGLFNLTWQLVASLVPYFLTEARWETWEEVQELARDAARQLGDAQAIAITMRNLGRLRWEQNRWEEAIQHFSDCLGILREIDQHEFAYTLVDLARLYRYQSRNIEAEEQLTEALAIFAEEGSSRGEAAARIALSDVYRDQSRWKDAMACLERSRAIFAELPDRLREAYAMRSLGGLYRELGELFASVAEYGSPGARERGQQFWEAALRRFEFSLAIFREHDDRRSQARTLRNLGDVYRYLGRYEESEEYLQQCLDVCDELGYYRWRTRALRSWGELCREQGDLDEAEGALMRAKAEFEAFSDDRWTARTRQSLGRLFGERGRWAEAAEHLEFARAAFLEKDEPFRAARTLHHLATVRAGLGDQSGAETALREAREEYWRLLPSLDLEPPTHPDSWQRGGTS
jgi:tetratricopeptide (TPR) repeat protein